MELLFILLIIVIAYLIIDYALKKQYKELESNVLKKLGFSSWNIATYFDETIVVKSRQTLEKYDDIRFFKENPEKIEKAKKILKRKKDISNTLKSFLEDNEFKSNRQYKKLTNQIMLVIKNASAYRICVKYISSAGNHLDTKEIALTKSRIIEFEKNPFLLMSKGEYNQYLKEKLKEELNKKQHDYYEQVNDVIDYANKNKELLFIKDSVSQLDALIAQLFDRTVNSIKKIKSIDSEEWDVIARLITHIKAEIDKIINKNKRILAFYESDKFLKIKNTCDVLMSSQRDFNDYIAAKADAISSLFGTRIVRSETINEDEYQYIRPYKKTITPFTAEVSAAVFASAENSPLEYVVKYFYPNKSIYPEQIQKLHTLIEELETLKEAKHIIENYKTEYQQYLGDVPTYVIEDDETGFYSKLGFANIDDSVLVVEYRFSYTSGGGMAKRTFTVPMTEENIVDLIKLLESRLTITAFTKEQRSLMTSKLRSIIKARDNYTCQSCGNSIYSEPNLLLEIDHIIPVSKGGHTSENNLQTLCWKCNRAKSNKINSK